MADLEKKLTFFSNIILNEAEKKKGKIIGDIEDKKNLTVKEKEIEILSDAYDDIQKAVAKYSKENNERVLKLETELKRDVIKRREEIVEQVFDAVRARIDEFVSSPEYKDWLIRAAKKAVSEAGSGEILLVERDMKYKDELLSELPECTVAATNEDLIGGVIVCSKNISADRSIREMLSEQHRNFLKTSGLSIKV